MTARMTLRRAGMTLLMACMACMACLSGCATGEALDEAAGETVGERPQSLTGTDVDGALTVDKAGRFVITADAVRLFDYFLTTEGEIDDLRRRALVAREAAALGDSADEAMAFYDDYVEYRRRFDAAIEKAGPQADAEALVQQVRALRSETVGEHPLFAEDDALVEQAIAAKRSMADGDLGALARRMQVAAFFTPKSAAEAEAERQARSALKLRAETAIARQAGASADAVQALRIEQVGVEAAARLAALDAQRAAWDGRIAEARDAIAAGDGDAQIEALLAERFDAREMRRVRTILGLR